MIIQQDEQVGQVPVEDLGVLLLAHTGIALTQALLNACMDHNVVIVFCDRQYLPHSVLLPLSGHSLHTKTLHQQIAAKKTVTKQLWQQIVQAKIKCQACTIKVLTDHSASYLSQLAKTVRSYDMDNKEAQAAQWYWRHLFGDAFRRNPELGGVNMLLNYGYAILRSAVARAIVSAGLHPALGIKHCNQYNDFCLADDLMEPFRPWVDWHVFQLVTSAGYHHEVLQKFHKEALLKILSCDVLIEKRKLPFMVALHYYLASFKRVMFGECKKLVVPVLLKQTES